MINIILLTAMSFLLLSGLAFIILIGIAIVKVQKSALRTSGPNSIQDIGEQVNAIIIDQHGNKQHIN